MNTRTAASPSKPLITEDWLAVGVGFLVLFLVLAGLRPELPRFRWATDAEFAMAATAESPVVEGLAEDAQARASRAWLRQRGP